MMLNDDPEPRYVSYDEALASAKTNALRDLHVSASVISYCGRDESGDLCHCEFRYEPGEGWALWSRLLLPKEKLAGEEISDEEIVRIAAAGDQLRAIRLYRAQHGVGLIEAVAELKRLRGN